MADEITSVTIDNYGIDAYKTFEEQKSAFDELHKTKENLVNKGIPRDTTSSIYANTVEDVVGSPQKTTQYASINAPSDFAEKNSRLFQHSTLINNLSRNSLDVNAERVENSTNLSSDQKTTMTTMLKRLDSLSKLQENTYYETQRYKKG